MRAHPCGARSFVRDQVPSSRVAYEIVRIPKVRSLRSRHLEFGAQGRLRISVACSKARIVPGCEAHPPLVKQEFPGAVVALPRVVWRICENDVEAFPLGEALRAPPGVLDSQGRLAGGIGSHRLEDGRQVLVNHGRMARAPLNHHDTGGATGKGLQTQGAAS